ncbi:MAG TPA: NAD(P)H-binding protein, partial [Candidatus Eisenbacteria bacterium]
MKTTTGLEPNPELVLLTGATGYVGGRLLGTLVRGGRKVRCLVRSPHCLQARVIDGVELVQGNVLDLPSTERAMAGVTTAFYLVHSMGSSGSFEDEDRRAARNFGEAAARAGVRRIIYLGGLVPGGVELSSHLRSRLEVGEILRASGVPTIE